jgi:NhaC family Na+:H+ antiporter
MEAKAHKEPTLLVSLIPVLLLIAMLGFSIVGLGLDIETGGSHIPLIFGTLFASAAAYYLGYSWKEIQASMVKGIMLAVSACLILMIIGCLIGTWILSGIVPSMIYYSLKLINPSIFLVTTCIICAVVSLATGSSWSTAGTVGVAMIGTGAALGIPVAMVAGAIISGAYFGDKMSPMSDTTNLAPATAGTDLFSHVRHMIYTVTPSLIISLILYTILGFKYGGGNVNAGDINIMLDTIDSSFNITPWLLLAPLLVIVMVILKIPALPALLGGAVLGAFVAAGAQGSSISEIIQVSYNGFVSNTGVTFNTATGTTNFDDLLSRGGLTSMMSTIALIFTALAFGGVMEGSGMLEKIASSILKLARTTGSLVSTAIFTCIGMNIIAPDQYLSIVVPGRMYQSAFTKRNLHPKNLSRILENSGTLSSPLIPWNTCGAFMGGVLGVTAGAYWMFAFLNLLTPLVSIIYGYTGFTMTQMTEEEAKQMRETGEVS